MVEKEKPDDGFYHFKSISDPGKRRFFRVWKHLKGWDDGKLADFYDTHGESYSILGALPPSSETTLSAVQYLDYIEYFDPSNLEGHFEKKIRTCMSLFEHGSSQKTKELYGKYYSPYIALVQSSGVGKTRLALQMNRHFFLIFICLRGSSERGEPRATYKSNLFLKFSSDDQFYPFLLCVINKLTTSLEQIPASVDKVDDFLYAAFEITQTPKFWDEVYEESKVNTNFVYVNSLEIYKNF
jgi:hypothetical protein